MPSILTALLSILAIGLTFGVADRFSGGDYLSRLKTPGRAIWYATFALAFVILPVLQVILHAGRAFPEHHDVGSLATWWAHSWGLYGLGYGLYRGPLGWRQFGGSINPNTWPQTEGLFFRHLISLLNVAIAWWLGGAWLLSIGLWVLYSLVATFAGRIYAYEQAKDAAKSHWDYNVLVEFLRGVGYGFSVAGSIF